MDTSKLTVTELKAELKLRGQKTSGKKAELLERLNQAIEDDLLAPNDKVKEKVEENEVNIQSQKTVEKEVNKAELTEVANSDTDDKAINEEDEKRKRRANKFSTAYKPTKEAEKKLEEEEKQKRLKRAERFGITTKEAFLDKKKKRAERFGVVDKDVEAVKKKQRAERFSLKLPVDQLNKIALRKERFKS